MDDGASDFEVSLAMVRMAAADGTTDIVASPHASPDFAYQPELVDHRIAELREAVGDAIQIHRGCDFHLSFDNISDAMRFPRKYSINGKGYLLVEFSDFGIFQNTSSVFERMMGAGLVPVITHPERNRLLQQRIGDLETWSGMGCLIQVTSGSFLGRFGNSAQKFSDELMRRGLCDVVASDAHDLEHRPPSLKEVREHLAQRYGEDPARRVTEEIPAAVISGIPLPRKLQSGERKKWYQFW
ncbi:MAG: exopolysaccharide biosynthesis protein [Acidobacteria bacterium]|nr:exopolysaccharide biosynthesis protein [Acidobacteriota bacterium]